MGKKVNHQLEITRTQFENFLYDDCLHLALPGEQLKYIIFLEKRNLKFTSDNGQYIIKPIPHENIKDKEYLPANEHLTMQIAKQVFNINTAENGLIFFEDGENAYITKRFDIRKDGRKQLQEDFAQISDLPNNAVTKSFCKDNLSYEGIALLVRKYVGAYQIEIEKYFQIVLFNYLFSNYEANQKNFSLYWDEMYGDYLFTPFYDLMNTILHFPLVNTQALALFDDPGELKEPWEEVQEAKSYFIEFSDRVGINAKRFDRIYNVMISNEERVEKLVHNSFLSEELKTEYIARYKERLANLKRK